MKGSGDDLIVMTARTKEIGKFAMLVAEPGGGTPSSSMRSPFLQL